MLPTEEVTESEIEEFDSQASELLPDMEEDTENTTDSETGLTVSDAMEQAEEEGIDLYAMEAGETVTFMAKTSARSVQKVSVTRGTLYRYADYGYGSYLTYQYTVQFEMYLRLLTVYSHQNRDQEQVITRLVKSEMEKH